MKFSEKVVLCNIEDTQKVLADTFARWIKALLLRLKLDPMRIEAAMSDSNEYSAQLWREYMALDNHIGVSKTGNTVVIEKHFDDRPKVLLGKWEKPELVRVKKDGKWQMEIRLNYWQLV